MHAYIDAMLLRNVTVTSEFHKILVVIVLTETDIVRMRIQLVIIRVDVIVSARVLAIIHC